MNGLWICPSHGSAGYAQLTDEQAALLVLRLLYAAYPFVIDMPTFLQVDQEEVDAAVAALRTDGHGVVEQPDGYLYTLAPLTKRPRRRQASSGRQRETMRSD